MRLKFSWAVVCAGAFLVVAGLITIVFVVKRSHSSDVSNENVRTAGWLEANGTATRAEYLRTVQLQDRTALHNPLTEQDVDWLLTFAYDPRFQGEKRDDRQMYASGVFAFASVKQLPATRLKQIYDFGVYLVRTPDHDGFHNSWAGCRILGNLKDKRAIPEVQLLSQSNDPTTRRFAENTLDDLGVEIPPGT